MTAEDEPRVRELSRGLLGAAFEKERPEGWHRGRTLVAGCEYGCHVWGHTSWTDEGDYWTWNETVVDPHYQGHGVGRELMEARAARTPGRLLFGATQATNAAMRHLLDSMGFNLFMTLPKGYGSEDALIYLKDAR